MFESVRNQFGSSSIWSEFGSVTEEVRTHLETNDHSKLYESIRANHRLLDQIGVVPDRVGQFIREIESHGGAAKICGAGSIAEKQRGCDGIRLMKCPRHCASSMAIRFRRCEGIR